MQEKISDAKEHRFFSSSFLIMCISIYYQEVEDMRRKKIEDVKMKVSDAFELPKEITLNLPKISIIGNIQMIVENHKGIIEYAPERIRINSSIGVIRIEGEGMNLRNIASDDIIVTGTIKKIEYI